MPLILRFSDENKASLMWSVMQAAGENASIILLRDDQRGLYLAIDKPSPDTPDIDAAVAKMTESVGPID